MIKSQRPIRVALLIVFAISLPVFLMALNVSLLATNSFVGSQYTSPAFPDSYRFTPVEKGELSSRVIGYLRGTAPSKSLSNIRAAESKPALDQREIEHLRDVRAVMRGLFIAGFIGSLLMLMAVVVTGGLAPGLYRAVEIGKLLRNGALGTIGIFVIAVLISMVNFSWLFETFHRIFFPAGSYMFSPESTLIQLYPEEFWVAASFRLFGWTIAEIAIVLLAGILLAMRFNPERTPGSVPAKTG